MWLDSGCMRSAAASVHQDPFAGSGIVGQAKGMSEFMLGDLGTKSDGINSVPVAIQEKHGCRRWLCRLVASPWR